MAPKTGLGAAANRFFRGSSFMHLKTPWQDKLGDQSALSPNGYAGRRCNTTSCSAPRRVSGGPNTKWQRVYSRSKSPLGYGGDAKHERELQL